MNPMKKKLAALTLGSSLLIASAGAFAQEAMYKVTITNLTAGQVFSPVLVVSHWKDVSLFKLGEPASEPLAMLAEGGATQPLIDAVADNFRVRGSAVSDGPVLPGMSKTIMVPINRGGRISLASMLVNTNDAFVALDTVSAYSTGEKNFYAFAYDAGSELNDELCVNIPGPACAGMGNENGGELGEEGEGFVHIHRGFQGIGELTSVTDWRNPVAKVTISIVR